MIFFLFCSNLIQSWPRMFAVYHEKSFALLCLKVYIDQLFDKLESGKINQFFWEKVWKQS